MPDGCGVLATAPSGSGKSTLVSLLGIRLLASFVSDDTVWVGARVARGFGAPFAVRPESPFYANASELWYARGNERLLVQPADLGISVAESCTIDVLLFPTFGDGPPVCEAMLPVQAFAQLVMSLLRPINDTDLLVLADLSVACRAGAIRFPDSETCLDLVTRVRAMEPPVISMVGLVGRDELDGSGFLPSVGAMRFDDAVAVWNSVSGTVVCVDGWRRGEKLARGDAFDQLRGLGYVSASAAGL